jgi:two-component system response regulator BaeR
MNTHILVAEDEINLASILVDYLERDGYVASTLPDGLATMETLRRNPPDLLLLDLMLPGMDGLSILRELRKTSQLPVILVTARVDEIDRLIGLEQGADDYICKPYSPREVVARVKTVLRRTQTVTNAAKSTIHIDADSWQASFGGQRLDLTPREFRLLQVLSAKPGRVFSRGQLLDAIYDDNLDVSERAVDSHMKNLRKKLAQVRPESDLIRSIYSIGFVFEP